MNNVELRHPIEPMVKDSPLDGLVAEVDVRVTGNPSFLLMIPGSTLTNLLPDPNKA